MDHILSADFSGTTIIKSIFPDNSSLNETFLLKICAKARAVFPADETTIVFFLLDEVFEKILLKIEVASSSLKVQLDK